MDILFTGASSFTGFWFVKELAEAGHSVTAIFQRSLEEYEGQRRARIDQLSLLCRPIFNCSFGSESFIRLINESNKWDLLCHHAADVTDYKSPAFNISRALANNTHNLDIVLEELAAKQCRHILITGSVFEPYEGEGCETLPAFSPYGLSKGFTSEVFRYHTNRQGFSLGKFVISNPFGPFEEPRFTSYLIKCWVQKQPAVINTPMYIRDNIHVSLLAKAYHAFVNRLMNLSGYHPFHPSGYRENQGDFTTRFAKEMGKRLPLKCEFTCLNQTVFNEPLKRVNSSSLNFKELNWNEQKAWDDLATFYQLQYGL